MKLIENIFLSRKARKKPTVLLDSRTVYREWRKVILDNLVLGKQVHDARIVAAMNVHQITKLLIFNTKDFKRFGHITLIDPNTL